MKSCSAQRSVARRVTTSVLSVAVMALALSACSSERVVQSLGRGVQGTLPQPPTVELRLRPGQVSRYHATLELRSSLESDPISAAQGESLMLANSVRMEFDTQVTVEKLVGNMAHVQVRMTDIKGNLTVRIGSEETSRVAPIMGEHLLPLQIDLRTGAITDFSGELDPVISGLGVSSEELRLELTRLIRAHFGRLPAGGAARLGETWQASDFVTNPFGEDLALGVTYTFKNHDQRGNEQIALITGTGTQPLRGKVEIQGSVLNVAGRVSEDRHVEVDMGSGLTRTAKAENRLQATLSDPGGQDGALLMVTRVTGDIVPAS